MQDRIDGRYGRLDVVRALAIVMVVAIHSVHEYMDESVYQALLPYFCTPVLFFMTSGALIFPVRSGRVFVKRRLRALLPAFAFWTVAYLLMDYYLTPHQDVSIGHRLLYCLYTPTWGTGWFVLAMAGLYLFAPFLSPWLATARRRSVEWFLLLWLAAGDSALGLGTDGHTGRWRRLVLRILRLYGIYGRRILPYTLARIDAFASLASVLLDVGIHFCRSFNTQNECRGYALGLL